MLLELDRAIARTLFSDERGRGRPFVRPSASSAGEMAEIPFKRKVEMRGEILDLVGNDDDVGMLGERALRATTFHISARRR